MYKKFVVGYILVLLIVGFSGCSEKKISGDVDKIELLDYSIETQKYDDGYKKIGDGFIHNDNASLYLITGTIKNIAGEMINSVNITAKFYDNKNNYLREENAYTGSIENNYTEGFMIKYYYNEKYFENVCGVKFEFKVT